MPKSVWELLLDSLEDLDQEQFKKFTSKLTDSRLEPRIKRAAVEGKDRGDIARKLIDSFTEQRALGITVQLLKNSGCNQTAEELEKEAAENGYSQSIGAGGSAAEETPSGGFSEANFIDEKYEDLVERATGVEAILDALLSRKVINNIQYNDITAEKTSHKMMSCLIRGPIRSSGETGKKALYEVLMKQQPYMMKDLGAR